MADILTATTDTATRSLRDRIARVSPAQAEALRVLHARPRRWTSAGSTLRLRDGGDGPHEGVIDVDADGVRLGVRLAVPPAADGSDALQWQDRRGRARILAWSLAHESALIRLSDALGASLVPVLEPADTAVQDALWLEFDLSAEDAYGPPGFSGQLRVPADWMTALLARTAEFEAPFDPGHWRRWPTPAVVALSGPPLTVADLRSLRPGDVVVVGDTRLPPLHARAVGMRWPVRAGADGWQIAGAPSSQPRYQETIPMTDPETADAPLDAPTDDPTTRLPVEVAFDLGTVEVSLGDIAGLQPGYVFSLPAHLEGANVTIRANGRVAGRGEVVAVGETLGVRVLSWS